MEAFKQDFDFSDIPAVGLFQKHKSYPSMPPDELDNAAKAVSEIDQ